MRVVVALGGNALLRRGEQLDADTQRRNVEVAARGLAAIAREHELVVTHGNGPQVGLLALQAAAYTETPAYPLDILGAESEGMVGYLLELALVNQLDAPAATLLTQMLVAPDDPAFKTPTKPIGPVYTRAEADALAAERGWSIAPDGDHWRRVVPSPTPLQVIELQAIRLLVDAGVVVICGGGGGIPVVMDAHGLLHGVEAVIDKDLAASLLARQLGADTLLMLTDVDGVYANWGTDRAVQLREATPAELAPMVFAAGSMGPKVRAAIEFTEATGGGAAIGALADAQAILEGDAGTWVGLAPSGGGDRGRALSATSPR